MQYEKNRFTGERPTCEKDQRYLIYESLCRYNFAKSYCNEKKILDIGCGEGFGIARLADVAQEAIGIDCSGEAIEYASANFKIPNLKFIKMDCTKLDFDNEAFDLITAFEVIEHLREPEKFLSETVRALKNNGMMILSSMQRHGKRSSGNPFHIKEYSAAELKQVLLVYYKDVELFAQYCVRRMNPIQKFIMNLDSRGILRSMRQRLKSNIIAKIERAIGTTPPGEVAEEDFIITKEDSRKSSFTIAICRR